MILEYNQSYWISTNPTPAYLATCVEEDTSRVKYGDGETPWNELEYSGLLIVDNSLIADNSTKKGVVAFAGGGQASATVLNTKYNIIETVATTADSVKCEPAIKNLEKVITNLSGNDADLFPAAGERFQIGATLMAIDAQLSIGSLNSIKLVCYENDIWIIT